MINLAGYRRKQDSQVASYSGNRIDGCFKNQKGRPDGFLEK